MTFHLTLLTAERIIFDSEVDEAIIPTVNGEITVLANHAQLFTQLSLGEMVLRTNGKEESFMLEGGFLDINKKSATLLADYAIYGKDIVAIKAEEAKRKAEKKISENLSKKDFLMAESELRRSLLELKVAKKYRG